MRRFLCGQTALAGLTALCFMTCAPQAHAQDLSRLTQPAVKQTDEGANTPRIAPPPAVPGSKPTANSGGPSGTPPTPLAPGDRPAALDLPPTDALFDAINRGDIASAKDAISRGADLTAQNVLGLTPLDLSVDLGRNDISFLLLSLSTPDASPRAVTSATPTPDTRLAKSRPVTAPRETVKAPSAPRTPQLFAGDGGVAVPQAGFLGFGSTSR